MKQCRKCKQVKPLEQFSRNISISDGKTSYCKDCLNENSKKRAEELKLRRQFEII